MVLKAIIPVAGLGTRLRPVTAAVPKAMFPLVDAGGRIRSVAHAILAEAAGAGIEAAALVVAGEHEGTIRRYFAELDAAQRDRLPAIEYVVQPQPGGFGQAVLLGGDFLAGDPFLVLLGDHVHVAEPAAPPCAAQVVDAFDAEPCAAMVGVQAVGPAELPCVGVVRGEPIGERVYRCADFVEKPSADVAAQRLVTPGLPAGRFLAHCGIYVFTRAILACLSELSGADRPAGGELELADAQAMLLARREGDYRLFRIAGRAYDTGTPDGYAAAAAALRDAAP